MPEYALLLGNLHGFHCPLEYALRAMPARLEGQIDLATREKAHLLRADLASLGISEAAVDALPQCVALPQIGSPESIVGCLYVVEGAGLGGQVLARKLDYLLGHDQPAGRRFFLGRPDLDPLPWPTFCRLLETCAKNGDLAEITRSARHTFEALNCWLNEAAGNA